MTRQKETVGEADVEDITSPDDSDDSPALPAIWYRSYIMSYISELEVENAAMRKEIKSYVKED